MNATTLRAYDPALDLAPDPGSPAARELFDRITAEPRSAGSHRRPVRIALISGGLVAAAVVTAVALESSGVDQPRIGQAGFVVSRHDDGSVSVTIDWSELSDPAALQRALDAAGARTDVFVRTDGGGPCAAGIGVPYSADAVDWDGPDADPDTALVVHPDNFPANGTFVIVVSMASSGQTSTFSPGFPQITGTHTYMAVGPVDPQAC